MSALPAEFFILFQRRDEKLMASVGISVLM
jgi:hypothetical protein